MKNRTKKKLWILGILFFIFIISIFSIWGYFKSEYYYEQQYVVASINYNNCICNQITPNECDYHNSKINLFKNKLLLKEYSYTKFAALNDLAKLESKKECVDFYKTTKNVYDLLNIKPTENHYLLSAYCQNINDENYLNNVSDYSNYYYLVDYNDWYLIYIPVSEINEKNENLYTYKTALKVSDVHGIVLNQQEFNNLQKNKFIFSFKDTDRYITNVWITFLKGISKKRGTFTYDTWNEIIKEFNSESGQKSTMKEICENDYIFYFTGTKLITAECQNKIRFYIFNYIKGVL